MEAKPEPPRIILVRPQMGENIGATARAMMNFGVRDLWLVAPRDGWPNERAIAMAAHAAPIIENATVVETLEEAIADRVLVYGTSARLRHAMHRYYLPEEAVPNLLLQQKSAILFGAERTGLTNDELAACHGLITIPTDPEYGSLNIAQSVVLLGYLWWRGRAAAIELPEDKFRLAAVGEVEAFYRHLDENLENSGFYLSEERKPSAKRNLRAMLARFPLTSHDVQVWHGILRALTSKSS